MIELKMWKNFKRLNYLSYGNEVCLIKPNPRTVLKKLNYIDEDLEKIRSRKKKRGESRLKREIERE